MDEDFLLSGETARTLFHQVAGSAPIADLHNHLSAADIAVDRVYGTLVACIPPGWRRRRTAGYAGNRVPTCWLRRLVHDRT
ncbi:MAG: glucuronate isomerase [Acidimicrobiales bacterium]